MRFPSKELVESLDTGLTNMFDRQKWRRMERELGDAA